MSKYLVTGGAGFIGSHIVEELLKKGEDVVVLDNFSSGKEENLSVVTQYAIRDTQYELIRGDIRDIETCKKACSGVNYILHQAALRSVPKSMTIPHDYNAVNIDGTLNILEAARDCISSKRGRISVVDISLCLIKINHRVLLPYLQ